MGQERGGAGDRTRTCKGFRPETYRVSTFTHFATPAPFRVRTRVRPKANDAGRVIMFLRQRILPTRWRTDRVAGLGLGLLVTLVAASPAQTVRGRVLENKTDRPLRGVIVALLDTEEMVRVRTQTADDGSYQLRVPAPGTYSLRFLMPGYQPFFTKAATLAADQVVEYSPKLTSLAAIGLDTIVVEGERVPRYLEDFYQRRVRTPGDFLTQAEIEKWNPARPTDLMPRLSGFTLYYDNQGLIVTSRRQGFIRSARECPPLVFVDGLYVGNTNTYDVDAFLWVTNLAAVEAYNGPARLPIEFNVTGSKCGVIAFWTKR